MKHEILCITVTLYRATWRAAKVQASLSNTQWLRIAKLPVIMVI